MICVSIAEKDLKKVCNILKNHRFCELRLDLIKPSISDIEKLFSFNNKLIITCREKEGIDRMVYLKEALQFKPDYIDIEIDMELEGKKHIIDLSEKYGVKRIHSYHNYTQTPSIEWLNHLIEKEFVEFKPSIVKIATMVNSESDNLKLLSLLMDDYPLVVIGMGDMGKKTRLLAPLLGSKFTFVSFNEKKTAPGQIDFQKAERFYSCFRETIK